MEMRSVALLSLTTVVYLHIPPLFVPPANGQRLAPPRQFQSIADDDKEHVGKRITAQQMPEFDEDYDGDNGTDDQYLGDPCDSTCSSLLQNAFCNPTTKTCECEKNYPVKLTAATGCTKPTRLGDQCWYEAACKYYDPHSSCAQIHHNAICQCINGYHSVSVMKPSRKLFCGKDVSVIATDFSTFAGVLSGIAVLSGLICFVLKLFNQTLYTGRHRYGNANLAPPILFNSDGDTTSSQPIYGSFLAVRDVTGSVPIIDRRLVSRASSQRTLASSRRPSSAPGYRGVSISASRAGSRRPSIASVHSGNSVRSYSMRRYEKEREQKEAREMLRRIDRLASSNSSGRIPATPSPHSTDDLLPTLEEDEKQQPAQPPPTNQVPLALSDESASNSFREDVPSTSKQFTLNSSTPTATVEQRGQTYDRTE